MKKLFSLFVFLIIITACSKETQTTEVEPAEIMPTQEPQVLPPETSEPTAEPELFVYPDDPAVLGIETQASVEQWKVHIRNELFTDPEVDAIVFNMYDGARYSVIREKIVYCNETVKWRTCGENDFTWYGIIPKPDYPDEVPHKIFIIVNDDVVVGSIHANIGVSLGVSKFGYSIRMPPGDHELRGSGYYIIQKVDESKFQPD